MHKNQHNEMPQDPISQQLPNYSRNVQGEGTVIRSGDGRRVDSMVATETVGPGGPVLIQDGDYLSAMQRFDRERIPERVVHAKGAGAFGYFEVTHDVTRYSMACVFSKVGKKTPIAVRFSSVTVDAGAADTVRDPRGFAVKFYTEDGNWDLVGNNTPIFFIRDPILFPLFIHSQKRNPVTHIKDRNMFWDFATLRPETTHQMMILFSDRGIPDGFRHMNGYGSHTFKLVNEMNEVVYCKFHYKTDQGIKNLSPEDAEKLAGSEPDYALRDLYNAIAGKNFPTWTFYIQVMTLERASKFRWDPLDVTKVWPNVEYPLMPVGKLVLNLNPKNYFTDVEQVSFNPASLIPGIETSFDRMLQGRLFAYSDTALHRLGPNYQQIPVNCPYRVRVANYERDGAMNTTDNQDGAPNYYPNSFRGLRPDPSAARSRSSVSGEIAKYDSKDQDDFSQPALFWNNVLDDEARNRLAKNIGTHLSPATPAIKERAVKMFSKVNEEFGVKIAAAMNMQAKSCL